MSAMDAYRKRILERPANQDARMRDALRLMQEAHQILCELPATGADEPWVSAILGKLASARGGLHRLLYPPPPAAARAGQEGET